MSSTAGMIPSITSVPTNMPDYNKTLVQEPGESSQGIGSFRFLVISSFDVARFQIDATRSRLQVEAKVQWQRRSDYLLWRFNYAKFHYLQQRR